MPLQRRSSRKPPFASRALEHRSPFRIVSRSEGFEDMGISRGVEPWDGAMVDLNGVRFDLGTNPTLTENITDLSSLISGGILELISSVDQDQTLFDGSKAIEPSWGAVLGLHDEVCG